MFCVPVSVYPCVCGANLCGLLLLLPEEMVSGYACAEKQRGHAKRRERATVRSTGEALCGRPCGVPVRRGPFNNRTTVTHFKRARSTSEVGNFGMFSSFQGQKGEATLQQLHLLGSNLREMISFVEEQSLP